MDEHGDDAGAVQPTALTVDSSAAPRNVPAGTPAFGWRVEDADWGREQAAYRVRVARTRDDLGAEGEALWDSGWVRDRAATDVAYGGPSLDPDARYWWTVAVENDAGERSAWSDPATFATAPETLAGEWIAHQPGPGDTNGFRSTWRDPDDEADPAWVQVDLGDPTAVAGVTLHPAEPPTGAETPDGQTVTARDTEDGYFDATRAEGPVAFGFPSAYRVEVADGPDFADPTVVAEGTGDARPSRRAAAAHDVDARGRYVRVVATDLPAYGGDDERLRESHRPWRVFALAALTVRDGSGTDVAAGAPVTASSSHESATWGRAHLVNGATESRLAGPSPLLRRALELPAPVTGARVHVAGLGYGELSINGERVGDAVLDPGWTEYDERVLYRTHDVTGHLREGENAVGLWLGRGWFGKPARQWTAAGSPRARLELTVECADGTTHTLTTDGEWRAAASPVVENDVYDGEVYDARREQEGWASPGFDDADWDQATVVAGPDGALAPQRTDPIRVVETLAPERVIEHRDGPIVDFGQNHTGWVELDVSGLDAGESVELRHAEALAAHGDLLTVDLRTARARDRYVASGDDETYAPRFTYHGYRYVQVSGLPGDLTAADVRSHVVHTDVEPTGEFACSNGDLERVQANARWGLRSNAHSVPTDCPQRDERQGFTGDGHLAAAALLYNFDAGRFHEKFVRDHADAQSPHGYLPSTMPSGGDPGITDPTWTYSWLHLPWQVYCHDATERPLREHYEGLRRYVDFWLDVESAGLVPETYSVYGDWVALEANEGSRGGPTQLFTDAYHYRGTALLADIAAAIGEDADAERYRERAAAVRDAFNERYFDADAGRYDPRTQAANAVPLALGLVPEGRASEVADALARKVREEDDGGLRTGFLGTPALLAALTEHGHADLAYEVVSRPEFPGWVYQVEQGATTVWERWDTDEHVDSGMNSRNHSPFALVSAWFYEALAGVRVDERLPRDNVVGVAPRPVDALDWAAGSVETPHGTVAARWERGGDGLTLTVTVPWNLAAAVEVPVDPSGRVRVDGDLAWDDGPVATAPGPVRRASSDGDRPTLVLDPGDHEVAVESSDP